jgi:hypothetical protein
MLEMMRAGFWIPVTALLAAALHAQAMFEGALYFGGEELRGKPKLVRVERETLGEKPSRAPEEESEFREDGQLRSVKRFAEGKLTALETYEYDAEGRRKGLTVRDAEGKIERVKSYRWLRDGSEEEIDEAGGKQMNRTVRRFDSGRRVIELRNIDGASTTTVMEFEYDERGRPLEARMREEGPGVYRIDRPRGVQRAESAAVTMRIRIDYSGENQAVITVYGPDGEMLFQVQTTEDQAGNEASQVLFEQDPQNKPANSSRIERRDGDGNWTLKTLFERNARTQVDEPVARLHRSIEYYE